jgi:hypothetical protein
MILPRSTASCWLAGMTVGLKVIARQRALMVHMSVKGQYPRWPLLHEPYTRVATAVEPTLVALWAAHAFLVEAA